MALVAGPAAAQSDVADGSWMKLAFQLGEEYSVKQVVSY